MSNQAEIRKAPDIFGGNGSGCDGVCVWRRWRGRWWGSGTRWHRRSEDGRSWRRCPWGL